jgi:predicted secreted hydrolase
MRMMKKLLAGAVLGMVVTMAWAAEWKVAAPDYAWSFPQDHWAHRDYKTEWWYFTGHLESKGEPGRFFGYQFTIFRIGLLEEKPDLDSGWSTQGLVMGHAAITDIEGRRHLFSELLYREIPLLAELRDYPDPLIAWTRAPVGTEGKWTLRWNGEAFDFQLRDDRRGLGLELRTRPVKPLVFQGPNGYSRKGDTAASLYYSFTRLESEGELWLGDHHYSVRGTSWMDKEVSTSQLTEDQVGWDWFSLQLDDGRDLMLYLLRRKDGTTDFRHATLVLTDGEALYLKDEQWSVRSTETWESEETGAVYPSRWELSIPDEQLELTLVPPVGDQENRSRLPGGVFYWEGAVKILDENGNPKGRGYIELTGYGENNKPPV